MSSLLRVDDTTKSLVDRIATETGKTRQRVVAEAVEAYERERFWGAFNKGYARLMAEPGSRLGLTAERHTETEALRDGSDG
ncbi:MAG: hypothetical protein ACRDX8_07285 [Acidimicrobiales bacterium]